MAGNTSGGLRGAIRTLLGGVAVGTPAAALTYALSYLFVTLDGAGRAVQTWQAAGWAFFNAHFVDIVVMTGSGAGAERRTINYLLYSGSAIDGAPPATSTVPAAVYFLTPVAVLVAAGYLQYSRTERGASPARAAGTGAAVVAGYAPLTVVGLFLLVLGSPALLAGGYVGPDMVAGVLAGVLYPLVFGAVGGALAHRRGSATR